MSAQKHTKPHDGNSARLHTAPEILTQCSLPSTARWSAWLAWMTTCDAQALRAALQAQGVPADAIQELLLLKDAQASEEPTRLDFDAQAAGVVSDDDVMEMLELAAGGRFNT